MNENTSKSARYQHGISLDILWILVILSGFLFFASLIPLPPNDFWWHLRIGEYIYTHHAIPTTNMYAWALPASQPFFYGAWFAELLFYLLFKLGNLSLIIFMRTLLIGVSIWLLATEAHRQSRSWRISALVIALLGLMITNNLPIRTQMWSWLPFVAMYIVLKRFTEGVINWKMLLLCPISMILWVNVHGSFILGLIIPGAFLIGEVINKLLKQSRALSWQKISWLGITLVSCGLAVLVNPRFASIINYSINLLTDRPSQQLIMEWQSPTPQGLANITFYASIVIFIVILAYSRYRLTPSEILLTVGFLWLAWSGQRYVIWYGMVMIPILAKLISELPLKTPAFIPQENWLNLIIAILVFIPAAAVQPWFVERIPLPETYWQQTLRDSTAGPLLSVNTPVAAAEYLKSHPGGKLFNELGYGSYLIWAIPEQGVFVDARVELFPYDLWMDYIHINNGSNYNEILSKYGANRILLDKILQPDLAASLARDQQWELEYEDPYAQVWLKNSLR